MSARPGSPAPRPERPARPSRLARVRTVPGRVRALAVTAVLAVAVLFAVAALAVQNARDGLRVIGHNAGPQVVATADLYFALSDMDAQLANVLLIGREQSLGSGRDEALRLYDMRRSQADRALLQSAEMAAGDPTEERTARAVLDSLGRYERLASQAMTLNEQANHDAGPPPKQVTAVFRQATDLMKLELLPQAYNLTLDNGTRVRRTYEDKHSAVQTGRWWVGLAGLVVLIGLIGLQFYLAAGFRRTINPGLALATVGTLVLVMVTVGLLTGQANHLKRAKLDGFDSVLALSRARAISNSAHADQSRYLLDPGRADTYEQVYFDKSQSILYVKADSLDAYYGALGNAIATTGDGRNVGYLGFYGTEAANLTLPGQPEALKGMLAGYQKVQQDDQRMRAMAGTNRRQAIAAHLGPSAQDFDRYDKALLSLTALHRKAFDGAIRDGDDGLSGWGVLLPGASVAIVLLILVGVRPRLAEYR